MICVEAAPPLTAREREILALLCEGLTHKEIAAELRLSRSRIDQVIATLKTKSGTTTTTAMVARLSERTA